MQKYAIITSTQTRTLGIFESREEVLKLRIFKDNPKLVTYLKEVSMLPAPKKVRSSNRWRLVFPGSTVDMIGSYTREQIETAHVQPAAKQGMHIKAIIVPHYAYHDNDDYDE